MLYGLVFLFAIFIFLTTKMNLFRKVKYKMY